MISIGRGIRWYESYLDEVKFCMDNGFDFMQIWFKDGEILINNIPEPKIDYIKKIGFPIIIHAVFTPRDFNLYGDRLLDLVEYMGDKEVIIHPVYDEELISNKAAFELAHEVVIFSKKAHSRDIIWYLENNSVIDHFHYKKEDLEIVYSADIYVEQLLDVAHIDSYNHLKDIIGVKFPKCLHVAGKHFDVPHEHLPLTQGDIDYAVVFQKYLQGYDGKVILEVDGNDEDIIKSKKLIEKAIYGL